MKKENLRVRIYFVQTKLLSAKKQSRVGSDNDHFFSSL